MKIYQISPSILRIVQGDLGKYASQPSVKNLSNLINVIDILTSHIGWKIVSETVNKELEQLKKYEEETGNKTIYSYCENWNSLIERIDSLRLIKNEIEIAYDEISDKQFLDRKKDPEKEKKINYKRLSRKISPYQPEIYWLINILIKMSSLSRTSIPKDALRDPALSKYTEKPFIKETKDKIKSEDI